MKIKPLKLLLGLHASAGSTKTCRSIFKALDVGKRNDALDLVLAPLALLPIMGKLAEEAGIIPEGQSHLIVAGAYAALPAVIKSALEDEPSNENLVDLSSDDMA